MVDFALLERVKLGNDKLIAAWLQVKNFEDPEIHDRGMEKIKEACTKLHLLNLELMASGFNECFYIENGRKKRQCITDSGFCWVCPSQKPYWREEWEKLKRPKLLL